MSTDRAAVDEVDRTRAAYDAIAAPYADLLHRHVDDKPVDVAALQQFCASVVATGGRRVLDIGCGTGATTALLAGHGLDPVGVDLAPGMLRQARRLNPGLRFVEGSMLGLGVADASVDGVLAWYSIIHVSDSSLPQAFAEFRRVLRPHGELLVAFQVGAAPVRRTELFGRRIDLTFHRRDPSTVSGLLTAASFRVQALTIRDPEPDGIESTPQAFLFARAV